MRKTIATVVILGFVWIGYVAWPIYDLLILVRALETRDVDTAMRYVYFDAVRVCRLRIKWRPPAFVGPESTSVRSRKVWPPVPWGSPTIVKRLISPESLFELLGVGWPVTVVSDPPPGTVGITSSTIGTIWQIFKNSEYGLNRFEDGALRVASAATLPSHVSTIAVALAIGRRHPSREYSETARG